MSNAIKAIFVVILIIGISVFLRGLYITFNSPDVQLENELFERLSEQYESEPGMLRYRVEGVRNACSSLSNLEILACMSELQAGDDASVDSLVKTCTVRVCALRVIPNASRMEIRIEE